MASRKRSIRGIYEGVVSHWNEAENFGHARVTIPGQTSTSVYFHGSTCREVTETDGVLTITNRPANASALGNRRKAPKIFMNVERGPKGPRAATWGIKPNAT